MKTIGNIITKEYENKWVALSPDHSAVVDFSVDLMDLKRKIAGRDVVYLRVPKEGTFFAF